MKLDTRNFLICLTLIFSAQSLFAKNPQITEAKVTKITDDDSIHVVSDGQLMRIRLAFIDCPEKETIPRTRSQI